MWQRAMNLGGGGSDGSAHGTVKKSDITTGQNFTIDTGLSAITEIFALWSAPSESRGCGVILDPVNKSNQYLSYSSSYNDAWTNFGTAARASSYQVVSVVGGVVTIKAMSNAAYIADTVYWFAR